MHEIEAYAYDVIDELLKEKFRLMSDYCLRSEDIIGFAVGPNEWLVLREQLKSVCIIPELRKDRATVAKVCGMSIYATPHPGLLPLFGEEAFWVAVEESRKRYADIMDA